MFSNTYFRLIEMLTLLIWTLNCAIAALLLVSLGLIAWLGYAEARPQGGNRQ
jgi:hypothetical protein